MNQDIFLTRFERAAIIGERLRQLAYNSEPRCDISDGTTDPYKIAEREFEEGVLPIMVKRGQSHLAIKDFRWKAKRFS